MGTKKLISEDLQLLSQILSDANQFNEQATRVRQAYEELSLGTFNSEVLQELQTRGIAPIVERYLQSIESDITNLKIKNESIKNTMRSGASGPIQNMRRAWGEFERFTPKLPGSRTIGLTREDISYDDNQQKFFVDEQTRERLAETYCRIYIEAGTVGEQLYECIEKIIENYREFCELNKVLELELRTGMTLAVLDNFILNKADETMRVNPNHVSGAVKWRVLRARTQKA